MTLQTKRVEILNQIDQLNKQRCNKCDEVNYTGRSNKDRNYYLCECKAAREIRRLGDQLLELVSPRKQEVLLNELTTLRRLTVNDYKKLKFFEVSDRAIYRKLKIAQSTFTRWKHENNMFEKEGVS